MDANRKTLRTWLPWVDATTKLAHSQKFIAEALRDREKTRAFAAGIWSSGQLVGVIWHNRIDWANRVAFPAYWLVPAAEGRGIMRAACQAVIQHAFNQLRVDRVIVAVATSSLFPGPASRNRPRPCANLSVSLPANSSVALPSMTAVAPA